MLTKAEVDICAPPAPGCSFCKKLQEIYTAGLTSEQEHAAIDALFEQADRAHAVRRAYGQRKGYHR